MCKEASRTGSWLVHVWLERILGLARRFEVCRRMAEMGECADVDSQSSDHEKLRHANSVRMDASFDSMTRRGSSKLSPQGITLTEMQAGTMVTATVVT